MATISGFASLPLSPLQLKLLAELKQAANGEKLFRPSAVSRLLACPGSIIAGLRSPFAKKSSQAAREGTAAHLVASDVLEGKCRLEERTDRYIDISDGGPWVYCGEEMVNAVGEYLDEVYARREPGTKLCVEHKLTLASMDPQDPLLAENTGTADVIILNFAKRRLSILDLKYGQGIGVPGDSPQLKDYALMASLSYNCPNGGWAEIETVIVQPRARNESERGVKAFIHDPITLQLDFAGQLVTAMETALNPDAPLMPGKHCLWCAAEATCPARKDMAVHLARQQFELVPAFTAASSGIIMAPNVFLGTHTLPVPATPLSGTMVLPAPFILSPEEIATILDREDLVTDFFKAVRHIAVTLIETGVEVPRWKLVQGHGHRAWKNPEEAVSTIRALGVEDPYVAPKLKSPAQVEKLLPPIKRPLLKPLIEQPLTGKTLSPASAARPAVPSANVFGALPDTA